MTARLVAGLFVAIILTQPAAAAPGDRQQSTTGEATAQIIEPLAVHSLADLDFGGIAIRAGGGGSVTIDPASDSASYSGVDPIACGSGPCTPHAARFAVEGFAHRSYRVTLPGETLAQPARGAGPALVVDRIASASANLAGASARGLLDSAGNDTLAVGGRLIVPAQTPPGRYVAQLQVVVSYD